MAGATLLLYIATEVGDGFVYGQAIVGASTTARLASVVNHSVAMQMAVLFATLKVLYALTLAVTLRALTRGVNEDMALLAFACRVVEGVANLVPATARLGLFWTATSAGSGAGDVVLQVEAKPLLDVARWNAPIAAIVFAIGSTLFAWLFLRGRTIPVSIAWLGIVGSPLVIVLAVFQGLHLVRSGLVGWLGSIPVLLYELALAGWLIVRGTSSDPNGAQ